MIILALSICSYIEVYQRIIQHYNEMYCYDIKCAYDDRYNNAAINNIMVVYYADYDNLFETKSNIDCFYRG